MAYIDRLSIIGACICLAFCGLLRLFLEWRRISEKSRFAIEFLQKLREYLESGGQNGQIYFWLTSRSNKMQNQMGLQGFPDYRPPYQSYIIKNYPLIVNMLPDLRHALEDDLLARTLAHEYAVALEEALTRHIGSIEDAIEEQRSELKNPMIWLREGVRSLLAFPAYLLGWLGLISEATANRITSGLLFKIVSGFLALVGFLSAIMTIVLGWEQFLALIHHFFS